MPQSKSDVHPTPDKVFMEIWNEWGIYEEDFFDPCPVDPQWDGLMIEWEKINYVNPPYTDLFLWVYQAIEEADKGNRTIMLLPAKTDQEWFHHLIYHGFQIKWIRGRLTFKGNKYNATQPHFLVDIK